MERPEMGRWPVSEPSFASEFEGVTGKAVVPLSRPDPVLDHGFRPCAPIITQLMAVRLDAPQTRARRRVGDAEGIAAYGAVREKIRLGLRPLGASALA